MENQETVVPINKSALLQALKDLKEAPSKEEDAPEIRDDRALALLQQYDGWKVLKKRIESRLNKLSEMSESIVGTESVELIGFKFLATRVAMAHLQGIIDLVEATGKYVSENRGTGNK